MDVETRMANAKKIGSLTADLEMLEAQVEFRTSTHFDRDDILEAVKKIKIKINDLQL